MAIEDEYDALLHREKIAEVRHRLQRIKAILRYGRDEEAGPSLFERELEEASAAGRAAREKSGLGRPDLLLLTVGTSPEPLLLAVAHHAPASVILLIETRFDAGERAELERLWDAVHDQLDQPAFKEVAQPEVRDDPGSLFRAVEKQVAARDEGRSRIVLDFTGAKKTMVAGAFLAAGFLDLEASYVDFRRYDSTLNRPVPGYSFLNPVPHPVKLFRLLERERLAQAFDARRYEEAAALAQELVETATSVEVRRILDDEADRFALRFERIARAAAAYALWQQGFYADAAEELRALPELSLPPTVELLGSVWPRRSAHHTKIVSALSEEAVFADPCTALAYFVDVLAWIDEPTIERRPRDAYLRLYGALESLISYVLFACLEADPEGLRVEIGARAGEGGAPEAEVSVGTEKTWVPAPSALRPRAVHALYELSTRARRILSGQGTPVWVRLPSDLIAAGAASTERTVELRCSLQVPADVVSAVRASNWGRFMDLRHKAAHWMAPVPPAMARDLRRFFRAALSTLVPLAVRERLAGSAAEDASARRRLLDWNEIFLRVTEGQGGDDCRPATLAQVTERIAAAGASGSAPGTLSEVAS